MNLVIFDIDGTLADDNILSDLGPINYYQPAVLKKLAPIKHTIDILKAYIKDGWDILFLSGRSDINDKITREWIKKHVDIQPKNINLVLRPDIIEPEKRNFWKASLLNDIHFDNLEAIHIFDDKAEDLMLFTDILTKRFSEAQIKPFIVKDNKIAQPFKVKDV